MTRIEVRCPNNAGRLFMVLRRQGLPTPVDEDNLMELACVDCRTQYRREGQEVLRVLHRYNFMGVLVDSVLVRSDGSRERY